MDSVVSRQHIVERLRVIANRAGSPTLDYLSVVACCQMRASLDTIASEAAALIRLLTADEQSCPDCSHK